MHLSNGSRRCLQGALYLLWMTAGVSICAALLVLAGLSLSPWHLPLSAGIAAVAGQFIFNQETAPFSRLRGLFLYIGYLVLISVLAIAMAGIWEWTLSGRGYLTDLLLRLTSGWNPIYDSNAGLSEVARSSGKGLLYFDAAVYLFAGMYESVKLHTILFAGLVFFLALPFFRALGASRSWSVLAAVALVVNPPVLAQMWTHMGDAVQILAIQALTMIAGLLILDSDHTMQRTLLASFAAVLVFSMNMSLAGWVSGLLLLVLLLGWFLKRGEWKSALPTVAVLLGAFLLGHVVVGFDPYIKWFLDEGQFLYVPSREARLAETPLMLIGYEWLQQWWMALTARPSIAIDSVYDANLLNWWSMQTPNGYLLPDVRLRGFGLLSPLIALLVLPAFGFGLLKNLKAEYRASVGVALALSGVLMVAALLLPMHWWARVSGFIWLLVPLAMAAGARQGFFRSLATLLLCLTVLVNAGLYMATAWPQQWQAANETRAYISRVESGELLEREDAMRANEDIATTPEWVALKRRGEKTIHDQALLPPMADQWQKVVDGRDAWQIQQKLVGLLKEK